MGMGRLFWALAMCGGLYSLANPTSTRPVEKLVLIGGGAHGAHLPAISKMVEWSKGAGGKVLRIHWASEDNAEEGDDGYSAYPFPEGMVVEAPSRFVMQAQDKRKQFLEQLASAGGVYFTGGDQGFIMDVLKDGELLDALRRRFHEGVAFGGTSAGLAIMSRKMFTGEGDEGSIEENAPVIRDGLGLLPGVMLDQHFIRNRRMNRLMSTLLSKVEPLGVGVDEDSAALVEEGRYLTALGPTKVVIIDAVAIDGKLVVEFLNSGQTYDLKDRQILK